MSKSIVNSAFPVFAALLIVSPPAEGGESGDWNFRIGAGSVDPKSDNGAIASVDSGTTLIVNGTYMFNEKLGIEVLAALPFTHDIRLASDGTKVGETKQLPPTFSLQYHFVNDSKLTPYVGAGVNYTLFFEEKTVGPLAGSRLDLDDSIGIAAQLGFDYDLSETMLINVDFRWIDIDTDAKLGGVALETVDIDPVVYSVAVGWRF